MSEIVVAKELTKYFEQFYRGKIGDIIQRLKTDSLKGEWLFAIRLSNEEGNQVDQVISQLKD